jgi:hypothetical protein
VILAYVGRDDWILCQVTKSDHRRLAQKRTP